MPGHSLGSVGEALDELVASWIEARLLGEPMESGRTVEWPANDAEDSAT